MLAALKSLGSDPNSSTMIPMGRTIHYHIFGDLEEGPVPEPTRNRILEVQRQMNRMFTWTCESLGLELFEHSELTYSTDPPRPWAPRHGWGFTKVGDDEWNAALVVRFLSWVSTQLPAKSFVRLNDEGDYVIPEYVLFRHGQISLDEAGIDRQRQYLRKNAEEYLESFEANVAAGRAGQWFRPVSALEYQDRPEIAKLRFQMDSKRYHELTLEGAADEMKFPWSQAQAEAA